MSLDVYLKDPIQYIKKQGSGIFIREDGCTKEISLEEWQERCPDRDPIVLTNQSEITNEVFHGNITHNLNRMAEEAGIYTYLWRPDELNLDYANLLIEPLEKGLKLLKSDTERFKLFNPKNGWGNYEGLINFVEKYLAACKQYPAARIVVSR